MSDHFVDRNRLWSRLDTAVAALPEPPPTPIAVVDLDTFDANAADLVRRAAGKPIRVASKSLRVPALIQRALARDGFAGVLAYTLAEALWLHETGISDDVVVAYPTVDVAALRRLTSSPAAAAAITLMADDAAHLEAIDAARHGDASVEVRVALDLDAGLRLGRQHIGPKRSPLFDTADVVALARAVHERPGVRLVGVMTYEGQVAGCRTTSRTTHQVPARTPPQAGVDGAARGAPPRDLRGARRGHRARVLERRRLGLGRGHRRRCRGDRGRRRVGPPGPRASSTTTRRSSRTPRRSSACGSRASPPRPSRPSTAAVSSRAVPPARTAPPSRGRRPACTSPGSRVRARSRRR